mgnify:CR=1 FL=1
MTIALAFVGLAVTAWCVARAWLELQRSLSNRFFN